MNIFKRNTKAAKTAAFRFYDNFWLTNTDTFLQAVVCFEKITTRSQDMDSSIQQSIISVVTSTMTTAVAAIQANYKGKMLFLYEIIEKSLFLKDSPSAILSLNPNASTNVFIPSNTFPKAIDKWNLADLSYFDPHLNKAYGNKEIVLVGKNVYCRNDVFFV